MYMDKADSILKYLCFDPTFILIFIMIVIVRGRRILDTYHL